jgi:hypothetical protein
MPKQLSSSYNEAIIPFQKMSFTPDVPAAALGPNEYNNGKNVETDVRGIRSMAGDQYILPTLPIGFDPPTFVTGGFRGDGKFWFIVACQANGLGYGAWFASDGNAWVDITPTTGDFTQYNQATNITEAWNGTVPFFNDESNPPMFWPEPTIAVPNPVMIMYSNQVPLDIFDITAFSPTEKQIELVTVQAQPPFQVGDFILINNVNPRYYNGGPFQVTYCDTTYIRYESTLADPYLDGGTVAPAYAWNYTPEWKSVYAKFMRIFNTPNVGSILVAGNLTVTPKASFSGDTTTGSDIILTTDAVNSWLGAEVFSVDFPAGTTVISVTPGVSIQVDQNSTGTNTALPIDLGLADTEVYPVSVRWSQAFGLNTAPFTWEPTVVNIANELEVPLRGGALDAFPCNGQFFLCSYWDTVVFSPINFSTTSTPILGVRQFNQGRGILSSNCWANTDKLVYGIDARDVWVFDGQDFKGLGNQRVKNYLFDQLDPLYYDRVFMEVNTQRAQIEIYYPDSNATNGVPNKMLSYRYDLDSWNSPRDITNATFSCESPVWEYDGTNWINAPGTRTVVYAQGVGDETQLIQKDQGYTFVGNTAINSIFRRDNIKLLKDYSGKLMVHRILPEVVNLGADPFSIDDERPVDPATSTNLGNVTVTLEGAGSVGAVPTSKPSITMATNTESPWCQFNQNAYRVNNIEISNTSNNSVWMCSAMTWQFSQVEDDR